MIKRCNVNRILIAVLTLSFYFFSTAAFAGNSSIRFNELLGGLNGDSSIQYVEMAAENNGELGWGPANNGDPGRTMLVFYNDKGEESSRYVIPENPHGSIENPNTTGNESLTVLFATKAFADLSGANVDFVIPPLIHANSGKVCFKNNPDNTHENINLCLSYGGANFTGDPESTDSANGATLAIMGSSSLSRVVADPAGSPASTFGDTNHLNSDFALSTPTPSSSQAGTNSSAGSLAFINNVEGEAVMPIALSMVEQGQNLFLKETFNGNGRTCETCHKVDEKFGLTADKIDSLPADDPLFRNEHNVNSLTVVSNSATSSGQEMAKPSDFLVGDTVTGSLGGSAEVLAVKTIMNPTLQKQYLLINGRSLNIPGNIITDSAGNTGSLLSFTEGNLNGPNPVNGAESGLEISAFVRGGRGLILENIDGFTEREVLRGSPSLMNLKFTAPYGLSGEFSDLQSFSDGAVFQHFPRSLAREPGVDFRLATKDELDALTEFQNSLVSVSDENFDNINNFERFVTTDLQRRGRDLFFGEAICSACHFGTVLASTFDDVFPGLSLDTGVARLAINQEEGLPTEERIGDPANSRAFSVPTLFDLGSTAPFFHDNSVATLSEAIAFYNSDAFGASREGQLFGRVRAVGIPANVEAIEAFLLALTEPAPIETIPNRLDFFSIPVGSTKKLSVVVRNNGTETLKLISHQFEGENKGDFKLKNPNKLTGSLAQGETRKLKIIYAPTSIGNKEARLVINAMYGTQPASLKVSLSGSPGKPEMNVSIGEVDFGTLDFSKPQPIVQLVEVRNRSTASANLAVSDMKIVGDDADQFSLRPVFNSPSIAPGESQFVIVSFEPTSLGRKEAELVIISNDPEESVEDIELKGESSDKILPTPSISVSVDDINFGSQDVDAGQISFQNIEIRNDQIAGEELIINDIQIKGDDADQFVILGLPSDRRLPPGRSFFVTIAFDPTSLGEKEADLRIESNNPRRSIFNVELEGNAVDQKLTSLLLSPSDLTVTVEEFVEFTVIGTFSDGVMKDMSRIRNSRLEFIIGNPRVAFSFGNTIFAFAPGVTTVVALMNGIESDAATLTILPPPAIVQFDITPNTISTQAGQFVFFNATGLLEDGTTRDVSNRVLWSSADTSVARPEFGGVFFAVNTGETTITAVTETGVNASAPATLTVTPAPVVVEFDITPLVFEVPQGEIVFYAAFGLLEDGSIQDISQRVTWSSSNSEVAFIDSNGFAFSVTPGVTTINAVIETGLKAREAATLTVLEPPVQQEIVEFDISPVTAEVGLGDIVQFSATGLMADGSRQDVTNRVIWSSSDETVAFIQFDGIAFSQSLGTTTISAVSDGNVKANNDSTLTVIEGTTIPVPPGGTEPL